MDPSKRSRPPTTIATTPAAQIVSSLVQTLTAKTPKPLVQTSWFAFWKMNNTDPMTRKRTPGIVKFVTRRTVVAGY